MNARTHDRAHSEAAGGSRAWSLGVVAATALLAAALVACGGAEKSRSVTSTIEGPTAGSSFQATADAITPAPGAPVAAGEMSKQLVAPSVADSSARSSAAGVAGAPSTGAAAANNGGTASEPRLPSLDFLGRSIIRTGSMDLQVESVPDAFERVSAIATGAGGFVAESRFFGRATEPTVAPRAVGPDGREPAPAPNVVLPPRGGASLTLRIPADRFDDVVAQLHDSQPAGR